jgi:hypothetical protein
MNAKWESEGWLCSLHFIAHAMSVRYGRGKVKIIFYVYFFTPSSLFNFFKALNWWKFFVKYIETFLSDQKLEICIKKFCWSAAENFSVRVDSWEIKPRDGSFLKYFLLILPSIFRSTKYFFKKGVKKFTKNLKFHPLATFTQPQTQDSLIRILCLLSKRIMLILPT